MESTTGPGLGSHRPRAVVVAVAVAMSIGACGGEAATPDGTGSPTTSGAAADTTAAGPTTAVPASTETTTTTSEQTESGGEATNSECSLETPANCGGTATLILAGETITFDFFACYFDDDAAAAVGSDGATFAALGQVSQAGGTASVGGNTIERLGIPTHEVFYAPGGDSSTQWHGETASDLLEIEGKRVTYEGDFVEVVDGAATGQREVASLEATCGP